jgi:hypothetical protein
LAMLLCLFIPIELVIHSHSQYIFTLGLFHWGLANLIINK